MSDSVDNEKIKPNKPNDNFTTHTNLKPEIQLLNNVLTANNLENRVLRQIRKVKESNNITQERTTTTTKTESQQVKGSWCKRRDDNYQRVVVRGNTREKLKIIYKTVETYCKNTETLHSLGNSKHSIEKINLLEPCLRKPEK